MAVCHLAASAMPRCTYWSQRAHFGLLPLFGQVRPLPMRCHSDHHNHDLPTEALGDLSIRVQEPERARVLPNGRERHHAFRDVRVPSGGRSAQGHLFERWRRFRQRSGGHHRR